MPFSLNLNGQLLSLEKPIVMGILNVTPDSFYDGGRYAHEDAIVEGARQLAQEGAAIIDIGGYSTRPDAPDVPVEDEIRRVSAAIKLVREACPKTYISIDTFRAEVADCALGLGAHLINDISGGQLDEAMFATVAKWKVPYIMMHTRGTPQQMKHLNQYDNLLETLVDYFRERLETLREMGVHDVIIDPGFGFAKNIEQNFELLSKLSALHCLDAPLLVGVSRKSMIYKTLGISPNDSLNGTTVLHVLALQQGAHILRVHDVAPAMEAIRLLELVRE